MIKSLQSVMHCPSCSANYDVEEMQFMGQGDGFFLLSMTCGKCSLPVWVNVFSGPSNASIPLTDLTVQDYSLLGREAITKNEVIEFHQGIKLFDGNFKGIFKK